MTEQNIFFTYFHSNIFLLKLTGFWVYEEGVESGKKYRQHFYNFFWFLYLFVAYQPAEFLYVYYSFDDLDVFLRALRDIGNHVALAFKAANYFRKRKQLIHLMATLSSQCPNYAAHDDFKPKWIIQAEKNQAKKWTNYFWYFCNAICLSMFLNGLFTFVFLSKSQYDENGSYKQLQPVNTVSPFGSGSKIQFFLTFIYTMVALTFYAWMIVALDSLFITLMSCITAHLKILQGAFKTLRSRCIKQVNKEHISLYNLQRSEVLYDEIHQEMVKCIKHLQVVLGVSEKLEKIYNKQTFFQTFISVGEMCFSLYLLSETIDQSIGNEITYLLATGFELLMYCRFGDQITEAGFAVSYALFESDWFTASTSFKKQLIFTMTRMKRPLLVTIGKITPLTLSTFLTMARGAYSFFTFLKQRHGINIEDYY